MKVSKQVSSRRCSDIRETTTVSFHARGSRDARKSSVSFLFPVSSAFPPRCNPSDFRQNALSMKADEKRPLNAALKRDGDLRCVAFRMHDARRRIKKYFSKGPRDADRAES
jgi:hypothetical protein